MLEHRPLGVAVAVALVVVVVGVLMVSEAEIVSVAADEVDISDGVVVDIDTLELDIVVVELLMIFVVELISVTAVSDGPGADTDTLELELPRALKDVELIEVLDMGYDVLSELILLETLELDIVVVASVPLELLESVLSVRLDEIARADEDPRLVIDPEIDGARVPVDDSGLGGADGRKMTVAKI